MLTRRTFMFAAAAAGFTGMHLTQAKTRTPPARALGLQLYMLDAELQQDFAGTLKAVSEIGYTQVELAGLHGRSSSEWKDALRRARLACVSLHAPLKAAEGEPAFNNLDALTAFATELGCQHVVCGMPKLPAAVTKKSGDAQAFAAALRAMKLQEWKPHADFLNKTGKQLQSAGMTFAYHNHNLEFVQHGKETAYDYLLRTTDPELVKMQLDVAWMVAGRRDPLYYLGKHKDRFSSLHVKDLAPGANDIMRLMPSDVGEGIVDWSRVIPAALDVGVQFLFVEQEPPYAHSPLHSAKTAYTHLRSLPALAAPVS
jgi:sugar phosphate isomerase/epimerase